MPIGQQLTQHVAEARSALARGAMMASRRRCAIVHATRGLPDRRCGNAKLHWPEFFFSARARTRARLYAVMALNAEVSNMQ